MLSGKKTPTDLGTIDPSTFTFLSPPDTTLKKKVLHKFLTNNKSTSVFPAGRYTVDLDGTPYQFQLLNTLLRRESATDHSDRFEILGNNQLNKGGMASIDSITGTLQLDSVDLLFKCKVQRVAKKQPSQPSTYSFSAKREAKFSKQVRYLGAKDLITSATDNYIVMHRINDKILFDVINDDRDTPSITIQQRLKLTIQLLLALQKIHEKKIIHRDLKPDNIFVANNFRCIIFDFGLSKRSGKQVFEHVGTNEYAPPEQLERGRHTDKRSDLFSMGIVIGELWRRVYPSSRTSLAVRPNDHHFKKFLLSTTHQTQLITLLNEMTSLDPADRPSIDRALTILETIQLDIKKQERVHLCDSEIQQAHDIGKITKKDYQQAILGGDDVKFSILKGLSQISDTPYSIEVFIEALGVDTFVGLKNKNDIYKKIDSIQTSLNINNECIRNLLAFVRSNESKHTP